MSNALEKLTLDYMRQSAALECRNTMGRFVFYSAAWQNNLNVGLWAKRDDCLLELPWGEYDGIKSVERYFLKDLGDREDHGMQEWLKGVLHMYSIDTPVIEVAEDLQTAKGVWVANGCETFRDGDAKPEGYWSWGKFAVDFIFEDGTWKFWHVRYYPFFLTAYKTPWTESPAFEKAFFETTPDRPLGKARWSYRTDTAYPADQPEAPQPYKTF